MRIFHDPMRIENKFIGEYIAGDEAYGCDNVLMDNETEERVTVLYNVHLADDLRWRDPMVEAPNPNDTGLYLVHDSEDGTHRVASYEPDGPAQFWTSDGETLFFAGTRYRPLIKGIDTP